MATQLESILSSSCLLLIQNILLLPQKPKRLRRARGKKSASCGVPTATDRFLGRPPRSATARSTCGNIFENLNLFYNSYTLPIPCSLTPSSPHCSKWAAPPPSQKQQYSHSNPKTSVPCSTGSPTTANRKRSGKPGSKNTKRTPLLRRELNRTQARPLCPLRP